jgi:hypothetical protein
MFITYVEEAPLPRWLTGYAFKQRMTPAERKRIRSAAKVDEDVDDFMDLADSAEYVDLDDPTVIYSINALEAGGLLDAVGRAAEILNAPVQLSERPTGK